MTKRMLSVVLAFIVIAGGWGLSYASDEHGGQGKMDHGAPSGHEKIGQGSMDHGSKSGREKMDHGDMAKPFTHEAVVEGVRVEFQVMSLASMNMQDPDGNTHHVMAKFFDKTTKSQIKEAVGKVKVIRPSGDEQVATLKDYSGILAANFTVKEKGKHGIICLFKIGDKKHVTKFWYHPH